MIKQLPSLEKLQAVFKYNPETGILTRDDKPVGCRGNGCGYTVKLDYVLYRVARIIWKLQTGNDPGDMYVDHINRDPYDNRWENLRLVTQQQNQMNRSGGNIRLVQGLYRVEVTCKGKRHGTCFLTEEMAIVWRDMMKANLFGEFQPAC